MAAYRQLYGFGYLQADCRGPGSAPVPTLVSTMGLPYLTFTNILCWITKGMRVNVQYWVYKFATMLWMIQICYVTVTTYWDGFSASSSPIGTWWKWSILQHRGATGWHCAVWFISTDPIFCMTLFDHYSHLSRVDSDTRASCGLRGWKNRPAPFPGRMS